jgi:hypothetical protein
MKKFLVLGLHKTCTITCCIKSGIVSSSRSKAVGVVKKEHDNDRFCVQND